jgi:hypothetical protein
MTLENQFDQTTFGYLSVVETPQHGFFGGYLLISALGRPLEFHCTAPIRPSRAQQILYGPTLRPFLLGEQIGGVLLAAAKLIPRIVITDQIDALYPLRHSDMPVVLLSSADRRFQKAAQFETNSDSNSNSNYSMSGIRRADEAGWQRFMVAGYEFALSVGRESLAADIAEILESLAVHVDLAEPFGRIQEAIYEAQRLDVREQESDGKAA